MDIKITPVKWVLSMETIDEELRKLEPAYLSTLKNIAFKSEFLARTVKDIEKTKARIEWLEAEIDKDPSNTALQSILRIKKDKLTNLQNHILDLEENEESDLYNKGYFEDLILNLKELKNGI